MDWLGPYNQESVSDPSGHLSGSGRVARGGAFRNSAADCRSAKRFGRIPSSSGLNFGFRPVFCRVSEKPGALRTSGGGGLSSQELPLSEAPTADWLKIHKLSVEGSVEPGTSLTVIMDVEYNLASMDEASLFFGFNTRQMNGYLFHGNDTEAAVKGQHRLIIRKSVVVPEWVKEKFDVQIDLKDKTGDRLFNGSRLATAARDIPLDRVSEVSPDSFPGEPDILEPPPPEDRGVDIADLIVNLIDYSGKVVKVEGVGRIAFFKKIEDGWYSATCSSKAMTSFSSRDAVLIPEEGLEVIDQIQANPVSAASFYIWVRSRPVLKGGQSYKMEAVGKRYRKSKNAYVW